jgi:hypothetical protein
MPNHESGTVDDNEARRNGGELQDSACRADPVAGNRLTDHGNDANHGQLKTNEADHAPVAQEEAGHGIRFHELQFTRSFCGVVSGFAESDLTTTGPPE